MTNKDFFLEDNSELAQSAEKLITKTFDLIGYDSNSYWKTPKSIISEIKQDIRLIESEWVSKVLKNKQLYHGRKEGTTHILCRGMKQYNISRFLKDRLHFSLKYDSTSRSHNRLAFDRKSYLEICYMELAFLMHKYWHYLTKWEFKIACINCLIEFFEVYKLDLFTGESSWNIEKGVIESVIDEIIMAPLAITREYLDLIDKDFSPEFDFVRISSTDIFHDGEILMMLREDFLKSDIIDKIMEKCDCKRTKAYKILKEMDATREYSNKTLTNSQKEKVKAMQLIGRPSKEIIDFIMKSLDCKRTKAYKILKEMDATRDYSRKMLDESQVEQIKVMKLSGRSSKEIIDFIMKSLDCNRTKAYTIVKKLSATRDYSRKMLDESQIEQIKVMMLSGRPNKEIIDFIIDSLDCSRRKAYSIFSELKDSKEDSNKIDLFKL